MNEQEIQQRIAAFELLMQQGYISLTKFVELVRHIRDNQVQENQ